MLFRPSRSRAESNEPQPDANGMASAQPALAETINKPDPLLATLTYLAAFHGRAISRAAILGGLPITDGRLSVSLYNRAARRAGLETEATKRDLIDIPALVLPAVLIMKDGRALVLLESDLTAKTMRYVDPTADSSSAVSESIDAIAGAYTGYAFLVRPAADTDQRTVAAGDLPRSHWFWSVVKTQIPSYTHIAIAAFLINILALATPLFTMSVYDRIIPNGAIPSLTALAIGMAIAIIFDFILRTVRSLIIDVTSKTVDVVLAANIFEHVMAVKMAQRPMSVGVIANQLRDFDSVREFFTSGSVVSATDLLFAILFIGVLFLIAGPLAWIPLAMLPIMIVVGFLVQKPLDRAMKRLQSESAARHGVLVESLGGLETVRASGAESRMQAAWERSVAASARSGEDVHFWASLALTSAGTAQQITSLAIMVVGVFLILNGELTMGALIAANILAGRILAPIAGIASVITRATQTLESLRAIDRIMSLERERSPQRRYVARSIDEGRIHFDKVSFTYPNAPGKALDNVSFKIEAGERVGIIGRVGSGKTTVGRLLLGFYDTEEGRILIDGVDSRQYDPSDLRTGIGFAMQDTDLFLGRLRDNIALGKPDATDEQILAAARLSGVESFIAGHPMGYDMPISEGGRSLSGGQKQAIGLARVLIRKPRILFFDEPTAHFDVRSEAEFLERLRAIGDERPTILISTHRLSLLNMVDRLLLFDNGRLLADGPRDKVLALLQGKQTPAPQNQQPQAQPQQASMRPVPPGIKPNAVV